MLDKARTAGFEAVRLAVAVLLYTRIEPKCVRILEPLPPEFGVALAAIVAAVLTLLAFWILNPFSVVRVALKDVYTRQPVTGPVYPVTAPHHEQVTQRFDIELRVSSRGLIGHAILNHSAQRKPVVAVDFRVFTAALSAPDPDAVVSETTDGVAIAPRRTPPSDGTWSWCSVLLTLDHPPSSSLDAAVEPSVSYERRLFFAYRWFIRVQCPIRILRIN